jgi:hypothetical protein
MVCLIHCGRTIMGSETPDPPAAAVDSVDTSLAALQAMKGYRACRGDISKFRENLGACDANKSSVSASIQKKDRCIRHRKSLPLPSPRLEFHFITGRFEPREFPPTSVYPIGGTLACVELQKFVAHRDIGQVTMQPLWGREFQQANPKGIG